MGAGGCDPGDGGIAREQGREGHLHGMYSIYTQIEMGEGLGNAAKGGQKSKEDPPGMQQQQ